MPNHIKQKIENRPNLNRILHGISSLFFFFSFFEFLMKFDYWKDPVSNIFNKICFIWKEDSNYFVFPFTLITWLMLLLIFNQYCCLFEHEFWRYHYFCDCIQCLCSGNDCLLAISPQLLEHTIPWTLLVLDIYCLADLMGNQLMVICGGLYLKVFDTHLLWFLIDSRINSVANYWSLIVNAHLI